MINGKIRAYHTMAHEVLSTHSARNWGNDLDVLATPILVWFAETTSMKLLEDALETGEMTVGVGHQCEHLAAVLVGGEVVVESRYRGTSGRFLVFDIEARDDQRLVFRGVHTRAIVDRALFVNRLSRRIDEEYP